MISDEFLEMGEAELTATEEEKKEEASAPAEATTADWMESGEFEEMLM